MVTSRDDVIDRVTGLEIGADDYVCKPFHLRELLARIRMVLRRHEGQAPSEAVAPETAKRLRIDGLELDPNRRELRRPNGEVVPLTSAEFNLLHALARHPGRVLSRDQLMTLTKGGAWNALDRSIDQQIVRLRHRVEEDPKIPALIKTVRGAGYTLAGTVEEF
jgi:two-component system phosphate regulon response regulator OmpR